MRALLLIGALTVLAGPALAADAPSLLQPAPEGTVCIAIYPPPPECGGTPAEPWDPRKWRPHRPLVEMPKAWPYPFRMPHPLTPVTPDPHWGPGPADGPALTGIPGR